MYHVRLSMSCTLRSLPGHKLAHRRPHCPPAACSPPGYERTPISCPDFLEIRPELSSPSRTSETPLVIVIVPTVSVVPTDLTSAG